MQAIYSEAEQLSLAHQLADLAGSIGMREWRTANLIRELKADGTPVTNADREIEGELRRLIELRRPGQAAFGEEAGASGNPAAIWEWVFDPIDGTRYFEAGRPNWATFISARREGKTVVAVVSMPVTGKRYWATTEKGAFRNGEKIATSQCPSLAQARIVYSGERYFAASGKGEELAQLLGKGKRADYLAHAEAVMGVAEGSADLVVTPRASTWDFDAVGFILKQAGGTWTDFGGGPTINEVDLHESSRGSALGSNGIIHQEALQVLGGPSREL